MILNRILVWAFALMVVFTPLAMSMIPYLGGALAKEQIIAGLSQSDVAITTNFNGSEILIYGAISRDAPIPDGSTLDVIVTLQGPSGPLVIRKKEKRSGIWVNGDSIKINQAPSFYAVATTAPLDDTLVESEDIKYSITIPRAIRTFGQGLNSNKISADIEALIRIRESQGLYRLAQNSVQLKDETLFRSDIILPANLTEGIYIVRIFLTRGGYVIDYFEQEIDVSKSGLERFLHNLSIEQPFLYGVLSLLVAVVAGWAASRIFRIFIG